ncbi:NAD(P)H-dependent oxidoreductase [Candidatus Kaiserbacteria bacterium]|nr:NAD(P)H-dependent oxidoreductase [Candidatus Kaiserbacteria bacterium]
MQDTLIKALSWRYAVKTFDPAQKITDAELHTILESGRMAPSSFGIEPWKFIVVSNPDIQAKMRSASYDQSKVSDASHVVVLARRTDVRENIVRELLDRAAKAQGKDASEMKGLGDMVAGTIASKSDAELDAWVRAQTYIPLGMMVETAALLGVDAGPMEGFSPDEIGAILGLKEKNLRATTMLALGRRGADAFAAVPKTRRDFDEVVEFVK